MLAEFGALDWSVIAAYFVVLFGIVAWVIRQKNRSATDYFLAGRHIGWFVIGASIFASNLGSEHIVGLAGTAAALVALSSARLGVGALLPAQQGLHDARVPRETIRSRLPLVDE